jgi:protein gp37
MAEQTAIEWCDATFNPWIGCTKVSIVATGGGGCDHCYAEVSTPARVKRAAGIETWGPRGQRQRTSPHNWRQPLVWNAATFVKCATCDWRGDLRDFQSADGWTMCPACSSADWHGARRSVFCASLADWLDNAAPIAWLVDLLDLVRVTTNLDWLLLSKRIGIWRLRMQEAYTWAHDHGRVEVAAWISDWLDGNAPAHVRIGATMVNQPELDRDYAELCAVPAACRFVSLEPLLGPVSFDGWPLFGEDEKPMLHWVIVGSESGHNARPMHPDWARSLRDQCADAGVPFLFKQWGEWADEDTGLPAPPVAREGAPVFDNEMARHAGFLSLAGHFVTDPDDMADGVSYRSLMRPGKKTAGRLLDGVQHNSFPA